MSNEIVSVMKRVYQAMLSKIKEDEERSNDPDWLLVNVHVASSNVIEAMKPPDTSSSIKSTFIGTQWIHRDEMKSLTEGKLLIKDSPIENWDY